MSRLFFSSPRTVTRRRGRKYVEMMAQLCKELRVRPWWTKGAFE
jgi:hypothetical protein